MNIWVTKSQYIYCRLASHIFTMFTKFHMKTSWVWPNLDKLWTHSSNEIMQAKPKKVSTSHNSSKLAFAIVFVIWFLNILTTKFMYSIRINFAGDNIEIHCIFTFKKILNVFLAPRTQQVFVFPNGILGCVSTSYTETKVRLQS
jgi:hypothetical protein